MLIASLSSLALTLAAGVAAVPVADVPPADPARRAAAAERLVARGRPHPAGYAAAVDLRPEREGAWDDLPDGSRRWRLTVRSADARWLVLGFGAFRIPPHASLRVLDPTGAVVAGPYGDGAGGGRGELWTPPLPGDTARLELVLPASRFGARTPVLRLTTVVQGYADAWTDAGTPGADAAELDASGSCELDASCGPAPWRAAEQGVVQLLAGGVAFCTGTLVTTTARDCRPYVLTAAHCVENAAEAAATTVRFNYARPACAWGAAPEDQTRTGATLLARGVDSDFALLELDEPVPAAFEPFFNGWDRSGAAVAGTRCIHHPAGDVRKASADDDLLLPGAGWGPDHWRVQDWDLGSTESGSSGAPLFDPQRRVIGQLHGGTASCDSQTWDEFGKLAVSWAAGGTPATRLADWLDPAHTQAVVEDGRWGSECAPEPDLNLVAVVLDDSAGNGNGAADPGERLTLALALHNDGHAVATGISATLEGVGPTVALVRTEAEWPDLVPQATEWSSAPHFTLDLDRAHACGEALAMQLVVRLEQGPPRTIEVRVPIGTAHTAAAFPPAPESAAATLTTSGFVRAEGAGMAGGPAWRAAGAGPGAEATLRLDLPAPLPAHARALFAQRFDTQAHHDGGVLEYTLDGGSTWVDAGPLAVTGGYTSGITGSAASPLAGRAAWSGVSAGWIASEFDLAGLAGSLAALRWRFASDDTLASDGWTLDEIRLETTSHSCLPPERLTTRPAAGRHAWAPPARAGAARGGG